MAKMGAEDVIQEMRSMQRALPERPTYEQVQAAHAAVSRADKTLSSKLDQLSKQQRPEGVPPSVFKALCEMKEDVLRTQCQEQKRPWITLIELENRHQLYDRLLQKAQEDSTKQLINEHKDLNVSPLMADGRLAEMMAHEETDDFRIDSEQNSISSGSEKNFSFHLSEEQQNVKQMQPPPEIVVANEYPASAVRGREVVSPMHIPTEINLSGPISYASDASSAMEPLSTIHENGGSQYPPRLLNFIETAAAKGYEELNLSDAFSNCGNIWIPESIGLLINLTYLNLSGNHIELLPSSIGDLSHLVTLDLHSNQLTTLPESLGNLKKMKLLNIEQNMIEELPWTIGNCGALEELQAGFNKLKALPEAVGYLSNLRILAVQLNCLKSLPTTMAYMTSLTELDAHFNHLEYVPECIGFVTTLVKLDVSSNFSDLRELPQSIGNLCNLRELNISYNNIMELPDSFILLAQLEILELDGNPWRHPPIDVVQQGKEAIFEYISGYKKLMEQARRKEKKRSRIVRLAFSFARFIKKKCEPRVVDPGLNILA